MTDEEVWFAIIAAAVIAFIFSIAAAFEENKRWNKCKENEWKLGFAWGYFYVFNSTLNFLVLLSAFFISALDQNEYAAMLVCFLLALAVIYFGLKAADREKWALLLMTLLSFNIAIYVINIFYLNNRWGSLARRKLGKIVTMSKGVGIVLLLRC